jgi:hypothetical protein
MKTNVASQQQMIMIFLRATGSPVIVSCRKQGGDSLPAEEKGYLDAGLPVVVRGAAKPYMKSFPSSGARQSKPTESHAVPEPPLMANTIQSGILPYIMGT